MGVRQATDLPLFASVDVAEDGTLASGRGTLEQALAVMQEYGATVAGIAVGADADVAACLARRMAQATSLPLLVQLAVGERNPKQGRSTKENPYYCPDVMVEAAVRLRAAGVQFLRASGQATPAYTGALAAAVSGFDVVSDAGAPPAPDAGDTAPVPASARGCRPCRRAFRRRFAWVACALRRGRRLGRPCGCGTRAGCRRHWEGGVA